MLRFASLVPNQYPVFYTKLVVSICLFRFTFFKLTSIIHLSFYFPHIKANFLPGSAQLVIKNETSKKNNNNNGRWARSKEQGQERE